MALPTPPLPGALPCLPCRVTRSRFPAPGIPSSRGFPPFFFCAALSLRPAPRLASAGRADTAPPTWPRRHADDVAAPVWVWDGLAPPAAPALPRPPVSRRGSLPPACRRQRPPARSDPRRRGGLLGRPPDRLRAQPRSSAGRLPISRRGHSWPRRNPRPSLTRTARARPRGPRTAGRTREAAAPKSSRVERGGEEGAEQGRSAEQSTNSPLWTLRTPLDRELCATRGAWR